MKLIRTILGTVGFAIAMLIAKKAHAEEPQVFNAKEFSLSLYGTGAIETDARAKEAIQVGTGIGADYFLTRGFGIGARAELSDFSHSVVDRSAGRLIARAPLWDAVAPYGYVEGGFNFEQDRVFAGAGGGVEVRAEKYIKLPVNAFAEAGLETTTRGEATGRVAVGVRFPLSK
jgi:hypothetical protein